MNEEKVIKKIEKILSSNKKTDKNKKRTKASEFDFSKYIVAPEKQIKAFKERMKKCKKST